MKNLFTKWLSALLVLAMLLTSVALAEEPTVEAAEAEPVIVEEAAPEAEDAEAPEEEVAAEPVEDVAIEPVDDLVDEGDFEDLPEEEVEELSDLTVEDVVTDAAFEGALLGGGTSYSIWGYSQGESVNSPVFFQINPSVYSAEAGQEVTVTVEKGEKVDFKGLKASFSPDWINNPSAPGTELTLTQKDELTYTFIMPEGIVRFEPQYDLIGYYQVFGYGNGVQSGNPTAFDLTSYVNDQPAYDVEAGQTVEVRITKGEKVDLKGLKAYYASDISSGSMTPEGEVTLTKVDDLTYTFVMPEKHVWFVPDYVLIGVYNVQSTTYGGQPGSPASVSVSAYLDGNPVYQAEAGQTIEARITKGEKIDLRGLKAYSSPDMNTLYSSTTEVSLTKVDDLTYTFTMPEGHVRFAPEYAKIGDYTITIAECEHGAIRAVTWGPSGDDEITVTNADAGDSIRIVGEPEEGYRLGEVTVKCGDEVVKDGGSVWFSMPEGNITVSATFVSLVGAYSIDIAGNEHGTATAWLDDNKVTSANEGDWIEISAAPEDGYRPTKITVFYDGLVLVEGEGWLEFRMPAGPVTVTANFVSLTGAYDITTAAAENGRVSAAIGGYAVTSANEGDLVRVNLYPEEGFRPGPVTVTSNGNAVKLEEEFWEPTFIMPAGPVTVTASFISLQGDHQIIPATSEQGGIYTNISGYSVTSANAGDRVNVSAHSYRYDLYRPLSITVKSGDDEIALEKGDWGEKSFIMPDADVEISATFVGTTEGNVITLPSIDGVWVGATVSNYHYETGIEPHAFAGETVDVSFEYESGFTINSFSVTSNGSPVAFTNDIIEEGYASYSFIMPDGPVVVAVNEAVVVPAPVVVTPPAPAPTPAPVIISEKKSTKATVTAAPGTVIELQVPNAAKTPKSFKSSNKKIATINKTTGVITVKKAGKVKFTFKVGKKTRTVTVKFVDPTVPTSIALNLSGTVAAKKGEPQTLTVTLPEGTNSGIKWKTSNKKIATVKNGVVTFKKAGTVTITATATRGKKKAKVKFKVSK